MNQSRALLREHRYIEASHHLAKAIDADPNNLQAKQLLKQIQDGYYSSRAQEQEKNIPYEEELQSYQQQIQTFKEEQIRKDKAQAELKQQHAVLQASYKTLKSDRLAMDKTIFDLKDDFASKHRALVENRKTFLALQFTLGEIENRLQTAEVEWGKEKLAFERELNVLDRLLKITSTEKNKITAKLAALEYHTQALTLDLASLKRTAYVEISLKKVSIERVKNIVHQKDSEIQQLKENYASNVQKKRIALASLDEKENSLDQLRETIIKLQNKLATAKNLYRKTQKVAQASRLYEDEYRKTQQDLNKTRNELFLAQQKLTHNDRLFQRQSQTIMTLSKEMAELENNLTNYQRLSNGSLIKDYERLKQQTEKQSKFVRHIQFQDKEIQDLKSELASTHKRLKSIDHDVSYQNNPDLKDLKKQIHEILARIESHQDSETNF